MQCRNCSAELDSGAQFCSNCGTPTAEQPRQSAAGGQSSQPAVSPSGGDSWIKRYRQWLIGFGAIALILAIVLVTANSSPPDPLAANSCEELADVWVELVQLAIDDIGDAVSEDDLRVEQADAVFEARSTSFELRAETLGCSDSLMESLICLRVDSLKARGPYTTEILADLRSSC